VKSILFRRRQGGFSLPELLVVLGIASTLVLIAIPAVSTALHRATLQAAAVHVLAILTDTQSEAEMEGRALGIRFTQAGGQWSYAVYADGNGNGIRSSEIAAGTDRLVLPQRALFPAGSQVHPGFAEGITDIDTGQPFSPGASPITFGICTFAPGMTTSPGSIYLTDGSSVGIMVRCSGSSGRIRILHYNDIVAGWRE
jgi:prepilin-type N-terminal cleavage/methylation domain-containing protein